MRKKKKKDVWEEINKEGGSLLGVWALLFNRICAIRHCLIF